MSSLYWDCSCNKLGFIPYQDTSQTFSVLNCAGDIVKKKFQMRLGTTKFCQRRKNPVFVTKQIIESTLDTCTKAGTRFLNNYDTGKDNSLERVGEHFLMQQWEKQNSTNRD